MFRHVRTVQEVREIDLWSHLVFLFGRFPVIWFRDAAYYQLVSLPCFNGQSLASRSHLCPIACPHIARLARRLLILWRRSPAFFWGRCTGLLAIFLLGATRLKKETSCLLNAGATGQIKKKPVTSSSLTGTLDTSYGAFSSG